MSILESIEKEANNLADLRSHEIIDRVVSILSRTEQPRVIYCFKKSALGEYVHSKIALTRAKRAYNFGFISENCIIFYNIILTITIFWPIMCLSVAEHMYL